MKIKDIEELNEKERRNGLNCPLSCQQVGIWINTATTFASTIAWLIIPLAKEIFKESGEDNSDILYPDAVFFFLNCLIFAISACLTSYLAYDTTTAIPTDILVLKQREVK